jgi:16S rRNA (guanine527-N7)-methyltransferase
MRGDSAAELNGLLIAAGLSALNLSTADQFIRYLALILRWNERVNLTSIRAPESIFKRHFVESIFCAQALPAGIKTLLDFGSGAGFPGIPIALCRPEIAVTLAESQTKKAAFLREAERSLGVPLTIHTGRAETLRSEFDCVTLRAVDRMQEAVAAGSRLVAPEGRIALLVGRGDVPELTAAAGADFVWDREQPLPFSGETVLLVGKRPTISDRQS